MQAILLTGEADLRSIAQRRGLTVHGTLWVLDETIRCDLVSPVVAATVTDTRDRPGCLAAIRRVLGLGVAPQKAERLPYRVRDDFLSPPERSLYGVLHAAVGGWATVCPKISLGDVFYPQSGDRRANLRLRNRIAQKHVDFLLCDPGSMRPLLGVELDDASHRRPDRQGRDELVDQVFAAAGLPLLRVPVQATYDTRALAAAVREGVGPVEQRVEDVSVAQGDVEDAGPPPCPKCGRPMALRTARRGTHEGEPFWGCTDYPRCRGVRAYGEAR